MRLWLTYAWKDNEEEDVDHVIAELVKAGVDVRYDRVQLLAGRRLWDQIDAGMQDPDIGAWAMYVTANSLKSEPCQEEIAYALDRALRTRGADFPLIGIFPESMDRSAIPSALATRLYVNLRDPEWVKQISDGIAGVKSPSTREAPLPFRHVLHQRDGKHVLEVWPRTGRWVPFLAYVPAGEIEKVSLVISGPRGVITGVGISVSATGQSEDGKYLGKGIQLPVDSLTTAHIFL